MSDVLNLGDLVVSYKTDSDLFDGAAKVVSKVRPEWSKDDLKFKIFTDGISNKLVGVYVGQTKEDMVLIRVYGCNTELIIDRQAEIRNMTVLYGAGCGSQLYATFKNGLAYEFIPGETLTIESVKDVTVYPLVAAAMAKMHKVDMGQDVPKKPCMWTLLKKFWNQCPDTVDDKIDDMAKKRLLSKAQLKLEVDEMEQTLSGCKSPIVFTHNDILLANIVKRGEQVHFIDYEYGDYNYQECDIANHFCEMSGVENMDFVANYPNEEFQLKWIRCYFQHYHGQEDISDDLVKEAYVKVNKFSLCYHLMWGLWGLVQSKISALDFDFVGFALGRLEEYHRVKAVRLAM